jgi:hypothetical protein
LSVPGAIVRVVVKMKSFTSFRNTPAEITPAGSK